MDKIRNEFSEKMGDMESISVQFENLENMVDQIGQSAGDVMDAASDANRQI